MSKLTICLYCHLRRYRASIAVNSKPYTFYLNNNGHAAKRVSLATAPPCGQAKL